ncbi:MAG: hypothetical protein CMO01_05430 [Thalassobius sp.]|nr:hypothetical protein [Thalassovita sp.]
MRNEKLLLKKESVETQTFKKCFQQFYPIMLRKSLQLLKIPELAEDAVQEVFINLWKSQKQLEEINSLEAYLFKCLKNRCLNMLRSRKRDILRHMEKQQVSPVVSESTEETVIFNESLSRLEESINSLPPVRKKVLKLKLEGVTNQDIAKQFNISENTVKVHYNRANKFVRSSIE